MLHNLRSLRRGVFDLFINFYKLATTVHGAAWTAANKPINLFLNEADPDIRNVQTKVWRDNMVSQLNTILITTSLISSVVVSSLSWADFGSDNEGEITVVKSLWYGSLVLSITAIASASQQLVCLNRLSTYIDGLSLLRKLLSGTEDVTAGTVTPGRSLRVEQAYLWQIPVMLMNGGLYVFTIGLCVFVIDKAQRLLQQQYLKGVEMMVLFAIILLFGLFNYAVSSVALYLWIDRCTPP
ncbi:hypothetical protein TRIATDRAFT_319205 [Trichoderma atroviride IMI 206040]|uniref:Uncharacterized protein n=1 Tax=Hypocrea atroviridis (strain ATCC 20476 / IMI 206040) TaxID=452589 RepID=G9NZF9_HYPAI|nr:uncharacterized protein TRIATDRAFT_319205 [Trichoderma atroviride IMI 206040]EHK43865.1 hypothetical protein TRIATDRAFT_319205 [Trichoderma atroviride IMI 206040]